MPRQHAGRVRTGNPRRSRGRAARLGLAAVALGAVAFADLRPGDLSLEVAGGRLTVGAVRLPNPIGAAFAQAGAAVALEDVVFASASTTYRLPRIEFVGATLGRDALSALLDPRSAEPWPVRLSRLSAERIVIPTITVEQKARAQVQVVTYRNVVATAVAAGRVASVTSDASELRTTGGPRGDLSGTIGRLTITDLDLPAHVSLYTERAAGDAEPLKRVYGGFSVENLSFGDAAGLTMRVARASGRDFSARPTRDGWDSFATAFDGADGASPADGLKKLGTLADILDAFGVGAVEFSGLEVRDGSSGTPVVLTLGRAAFAGAADGRPAEFGLENMAVSTGDGTVRFGRIGFSGFSFAPTVSGLKALAERPADEVGAEDFRKLVPTVGTVRMADLAVDMAPAAEPAAPAAPVAPAAPKPDRVRFGVKSAEVTADRPINGVPTRFATTVDGVAFPLPAGSTDDTVKRLAAMGYRDLELSFASAADWVESASELRISDLSFRGRDMGGVTVRATLGNLTRDAFDPDQAVAAVALLGATARSLELTVEDKGLAERIVAQEARGRRVSPEEVRREYGVAAAVGVPALLGNSPQAKAVAQAVARFMAKPGRLVVTARAKDPAGLGAADLAALADPTAVLERLDVTARAE